MNAYDRGVQLLADVVQAFDAAGIEIPSRQLVYMSPIPADCEQVAVLFNGITPFGGEGGGELSNCLTTPLITGYSVIVTRKTCAVSVKKGSDFLPPTPASMMQAAEVSAKDMDVLVDVLSGVGEFSAAAIIAQSPNGGLQTVELDVSLPYAGF